MNNQLFAVENITMDIIPIFEERCGTWHESGLLASLDRKGFTPNKCFTELLANSNDAQATKILWKITCEYIKLVDDGIGMTCKKLSEMFDMFRANNNDRKTMGVSGLGGKEGMYILSKKENKEPTTVILYTHTADGDYLKAIVPWKEIFNEKKYTGKILINKMTTEEIYDFIADREDFQFKHGTTIRFEYNDELKNLIENSFNIKYNNKQKNPHNNRWEFIFGQSNSKIILEKSDGSPIVELSRYNYFSGNDMEFYEGKDIDYITHYVDDKNNDRFIYMDEDSNLEIQQHGKNGYKTEPTSIKIHQSWKQLGLYEIRNGMRTDDRIFNPRVPFAPSSATMYLNSYDAKFFIDAEVEYVKECLSGCAVYRNEQLITKINFDEKRFNATTSRAGGNAMIDKFYHRTEIRYSTESTQDNRMDIAMGIQENKNQHQNVLPKPLERLIAYTKSKHLKKIYDYFDRVVKEKAEQDKKKRALEAEKLRLENEQKMLEEAKRKEEETRKQQEIREEEERVKAEKKRQEEELKRLTLEEEEEEQDEEENNSKEEHDEEEEEYSSAKEDSSGEEDEEEHDDEEEEEYSSAKEDSSEEDEEEHDDEEGKSKQLIILKSKILDKINSEDNYEKIKEIYELLMKL